MRNRFDFTFSIPDFIKQNTKYCNIFRDQGREMSTPSGFPENGLFLNMAPVEDFPVPDGIPCLIERFSETGEFSFRVCAGLLGAGPKATRIY